MNLEGIIPYTKADAEKYNQLHWWPGLTFGDILDKAADVYPEKEAIVDDTKRLTYAELREKADRLAIGMLDLGIQPLDRVLLQLPNWHEFVVAYFALQKIGAIPVILIARYRQYEINHLARLSGAAAWIVAEKFKKTDFLPIIEDVTAANPRIKNVIITRGKSREAYQNLETLIHNAERNESNRHRLKEGRPDPMLVAHMGPTGGTTGLPKIAPRTHNAVLCKAEYSAKACEISHDTVCLIVAPAAHDLPFANGICTTIFACGKLIMMNRTDPESICRMIQNEKINTVIWVPTMTYRVVNYERLKDFDLSSLKRIHAGAGFSSPELIHAAVDKLGCAYLSGYGGTEGMQTLTRKHSDMDTICRTIGKPTCPYDTYKVIDSSGNDLPMNTPGELVVKGPSMFTGYYNMPEENANVFTGAGFFRTGDLAMIDESGYITLSGRLKDMIKRGGESIFAPEIEKLIDSHPDVALVAVVGMPDPEMGERICAYIQPADGITLTFEQIIGYLKDQKASVLQFPERIEFIAEMPFTPAGKINKRAIREDIAEKLKQSDRPSFTDG